MIVRSSTSKLQHLAQPSSPFFPISTTPIRRAAHASKIRSKIPTPTPFVPDAPTFLTLIGRELSKHSSKIPSWDALFSLSSKQLRDLGVEPARARRYLLWWREKFRRGEYGIGGDLTQVVDGVAEVRVVERGNKKVVVNTKVGTELESDAVAAAPPVKGMKTVGHGAAAGSYFDSVKGSNGTTARIQIKEGMWEVKRGRKIHGGERRRKNVLSRIAAKARGTLK